MIAAVAQSHETAPAPPDHLRPLRIISLMEGCSLLALIGVAVPLKHLAGLPITVSIIGPIHGLIFLVYLRMVVTTAFSEDWGKAEILRMLITALVPFGAFFNARFLQRKSDHKRRVSIGQMNAASKLEHSHD